jgi:AcrR family transcriptional regulator
VVARTLNPARHAVRREAFVEAGQGLIATKGYERLNVQDVIDAVGASKGAFYHYFASKEALLEAVVDRIGSAALAAARPVADDPDRSAVEKLEGVFGAMAQFKAERRELVMALLDVWLSDDNALFREKVRRRGVDWVAPLLADIIRDGIAAGEFNAGPAEETARVLIALMLSTNEDLARMIVRGRSDPIPLEIVERTITAYTEAMERILGLPPPRRLTIMDPATIRFWFA